MGEQETRELNSEQQIIFDWDVRELERIGGERGIDNFAGRTKFGLDPAAMLSIDQKRDGINPDVVKVEGTKPFAEEVARKLGTTAEEIWPLITKLHKEGPWASAKRLQASEDSQIQAYIVLAEACHESDWPGYDPHAYLEDRARILDRLGSFEEDGFQHRKEELQNRVKKNKIERVTVGSTQVEIPVAEGDVALPLSVQGYRGCVVKGGEMRFAQTTDIPDSLLESRGLVKGFVEDYDSESGGFKRFSLEERPNARVIWVKSGELGKDINDMKPSVKRIASGYVLTYENEELAVNLVAEAIAESEK